MLIMIKAIITVVLIPEVLSKSKRYVELEIAKSLQCSWLSKVERVAISHHPIPNGKTVIHHRMPDGKEVRIHG
jgi:hypothetical protein